MNTGLEWAGLVPLGLVLAWLAPLAGYDIRRREVPHIAWVGIPAIGTAIWALVRGDWPLTVLTAIVMVVSEAPRLGKTAHRVAIGAAVIGMPFLVFATRPEALAGALFIVGSWIMFELSWWAGADALVAITLALLWPDLTLLVCVAIGHLLWGLTWRWTRRKTPQLKPRKKLARLTPEELGEVGAPGLPSLALAVAFYTVVVLGTALL